MINPTQMGLHDSSVLMKVSKLDFGCKRGCKHRQNLNRDESKLHYCVYIHMYVHLPHKWVQYSFILENWSWRQSSSVFNELRLYWSNFFHAESRVSPADDGKLSLEEFQAFFSDGTLNEEELEKLFHIIDSDNTRSESP